MVRAISSAWMCMMSGTCITRCRSGRYGLWSPESIFAKKALGIRIENNVVIQKNGVSDLMKNIPIEVEEIEEIMNA